MAFVSAETLDQEADAMLDAMLGGNTPKVAEIEPDQPVETPDDTVNTEPEQKTDQTQTPRSQDERDPLEVANERVANAQRKMTEATQEAASLRKQVAELQQKLAQIQESQSKPMSSITEIDTLEALANEYPDLIAPVISRIRVLESQVNNVGQKFEQDAKSKQEQEQAAAMEAHMNAILSSHPDAVELSQSIDFQVWLDGMPPMYRQSIEKGTAQDVVSVLNAFKGETPVKQPSENKLEQAKRVATPNPRNVVQKSSKPTFTREQIRNMSASDFMANEALIDEAYREGRVI